MTPEEILKWAVADYRTYGERSNVFFRLDNAEKIAVDNLFLHEMKHPICWQPGTREYRFTAIVKEMALDVEKGE